MPQKSKKKKSNYLGLYVAGAGAVVLLLILWGLSGAPEPAPKQVQNPTVTARVNLSDRQKMELYKSLSDLKQMLQGAGGSSSRSYKVLADRYGISEAQVSEVEQEGRSKGWPK